MNAAAELQQADPCVPAAKRLLEVAAKVCRARAWLEAEHIREPDRKTRAHGLVLEALQTLDQVRAALAGSILKPAHDEESAS